MLGGSSGGGTRDVNNGDVHDSSDDDQTEVKSAYSPHLSSRVDNPDVEAIQTDFARQTHIGDATVATHVYDDVTYVGAHVKNKYNVDAKLMSGSRDHLFSKLSADVQSMSEEKYGADVKTMSTARTMLSTNVDDDSSESDPEAGWMRVPTATVERDKDVKPKKPRRDVINRGILSHAGSDTDSDGDEFKDVAKLPKFMKYRRYSKKGVYTGDYKLE